MYDSLLARLMADVDRFPEVLPALFVCDVAERRAILARPVVRSALWRSPASELRTLALRDAAVS
jgi:hypothetical protein